MTEETNSGQPQPIPQDQQPQPQVTLHGGTYPQPDGKWTVCIWFAGFNSEGAAQHMSGQLEQLIKNAFQPPKPSGS